MKLGVEPGRYIVAVSGGVDSMALLDLLSRLPKVELVVAHFNHGIRPDSREDEKLVAEAAAAYGLPFEAGYGELGAGASEETARRARYGFLKQVRKKYGARAIITAHHQDDLIETAIINLLRGTGRRGLVAISSSKDILRPMLGYTKARILDYAQEKNLKWREDSTNQSPDYLRNYIRQNIMPKVTPAMRRQFLRQIGKIQDAAPRIDSWLEELAGTVSRGGDIDRGRFSALPSELGNELLMHWLRRSGLKDFDKRTINRLNVAIRTSKPGSRHPVKAPFEIEVGAKSVRFKRAGQNAS
ncbi:MAG TPA: tRNA lysidine(34) synthetase TilS [Candidatus Saccharimonadales bacterium]|nr:tRNA lysidine(34) synthetase TilS [Candidatus Saccharimonadales bacterium]